MPSFCHWHERGGNKVPATLVTKWNNAPLYLCDDCIDNAIEACANIKLLANEPTQQSLTLEEQAKRRVKALSTFFFGRTIPPDPKITHATAACRDCGHTPDAHDSVAGCMAKNQGKFCPCPTYNKG